MVMRLRALSRWPSRRRRSLTLPPEDLAGRGCHRLSSGGWPGRLRGRRRTFLRQRPHEAEAEGIRFAASEKASVTTRQQIPSKPCPDGNLDVGCARQSSLSKMPS